MGLVYLSPGVYEHVMTALYWPGGNGRLREIARHIPERSSVLDICSGPGLLFKKELLSKNVSYLGLDHNPRFVAHINRFSRSTPTGEVGAMHGDVNGLCHFPEADVVVMTGSLYHFPKGADAILRKMLQAARAHVILSEPVINLATSKNPVVRRLASWATATPGSEPGFRFNEMTLNALLDPYRNHILDQKRISGGREILTVMRPLPRR